MIKIDTDVQYLKGVGPKIAALLARKDIAKVGDALTWFPRTYEDLKAVKHISELCSGEITSFMAQIGLIREIPLGRTSRRIYEVIFQDDTGRIAGKWFRVPFRNYFKNFKQGTWVRVTGEVKAYRHTLEIHHPDLQKRDEDSGITASDKGLLPIYSETEGLNQKLIRKVIAAAFENTKSEIKETLPEWLLRKNDLPPLADSLERVHKPGDESFEVWSNFKSPYQQRLIFEEFFWMELLLAQSRAGIIKEKAYEMKLINKLPGTIRKSLPFELTADQEKVIAEITEDLLKPHPMHRLVQGDVGSGKTMVAFFAASQVIENGFQVALMAPTEILAEQHYLKAKELFEPLGVKVCLLTGGQKNKVSQEVKKQIAEGEMQFIVGTHALIQGDVDFFKLGLVIIDEQHRFGVKQRADLKKKGSLSPHFLVMTATPIPRTLAMTVYGDLDVSIIRMMPKGRQPITTKLVHDKKRTVVYDFIKDQLIKKKQAYIIYPLVEETEKMDLKNATDQSEILAKQFAPFKVGLLHGRLKSAEKEELMREFKAGNIHILVSTTVVEVGVDVPNATIMMIEHAERFGLSQLHQLRGRVGRGADKSYCILMAGYGQSDDSKQRLEIMTQTQDGFKIAEKDLEIRGPGEFLGTRQSGLPGFRLANLVRDMETLTQARSAAFDILKTDPKLTSPDNALLKEAIIDQKRKSLLFAKIG